MAVGSHRDQAQPVYVYVCGWGRILLFALYNGWDAPPVTLIAGSAVMDG